MLFYGNEFVIWIWDGIRWVNKICEIEIIRYWDYVGVSIGVDYFDVVYYVGIVVCIVNYVLKYRYNVFFFLGKFIGWDIDVFFVFFVVGMVCYFIGVFKNKFIVFDFVDLVFVVDIVNMD